MDLLKSQLQLNPVSVFIVDFYDFQTLGNQISGQRFIEVRRKYFSEIWFHSL